MSQKKQFYHELITNLNKLKDLLHLCKDTTKNALNKSYALDPNKIKLSINDIERLWKEIHNHIKITTMEENIQEIINSQHLIANREIFLHKILSHLNQILITIDTIVDEIYIKHILVCEKNDDFKLILI